MRSSSLLRTACCLALAVQLPTALAQTSDFLSTQRFDGAPNGGPSDLLTGDLNNDGAQDVVLIENIAGGYSAHLGDGNGDFALSDSNSVFTFSQAGDLADVNDDGELDIVIRESLTNDRFTVYLGNGDGTFRLDGAPRLDLIDVSDFGLADLNGDGNPELIALPDFSSLAVLPSTPDGAQGVYWGEPALIPLGPGAVAEELALVDVDDDGDTDVVINFSQPSPTYTIFLNDGAGALVEGQSFAAGGFGGTRATTGDFDNDGVLDLAFTFDGGNFDFISILPGLGGGTFGPAVNTQINQFGVLEILVDDFNDDGFADIVGPAFIDDSLLWIPGNGDFTFGSFVLGGSGGATFAAAQLDANADGIDDVISINISSDDFAVHIGTGDARFFNTPRTTAIGARVAQIAAGDVTGDSRIDVITADSSSGSLSILSDLENGVFTQREVLSNGLAQPTSVAVADLNGDGADDLVVADLSLDTVSVFLGDGAGGLGSPTSVSVCGDTLRVAVGDLNGDDNLDAVAACFDDTVTVLIGDGNGGLTPTGTFLGADDPQELRLVDLNGDEVLDILLADSALGASAVRALFGNGDGTFGPATALVPGSTIATVAAGDVNGDGTIDLAVGDLDQGLLVAIGVGSGAFDAAFPIDGPSAPIAVELFDANEDGYDDVLAIEAQGVSTDKAITVTPSNGDGSFDAADRFAVATGVDAPFAQPSELRTLTLADVNADGRADVLAGSAAAEFDGVLSVDLNRFAPLGEVDTDGDGVPDSADNCSLLPNPGQLDSNGDGFGNRCDPDLNNDNIVNLGDVALFRDAFGTDDPDADFTGDGIVNGIDFRILRSFFGSPPGPGAQN
ncbi:MAG: FG-GAP-like repeat-containing protein [Pseudomonadota bacterium]